MARSSAGSLIYGCLGGESVLRDFTPSGPVPAIKAIPRAKSEPTRSPRPFSFRCRRSHDEWSGSDFGSGPSGSRHGNCRAGVIAHKQYPEPPGGKRQLAATCRGHCQCSYDVWELNDPSNQGRNCSADDVRSSGITHVCVCVCVSVWSHASNEATGRVSTTSSRGITVQISRYSSRII